MTYLNVLKSGNFIIMSMYKARTRGPRGQASKGNFIMGKKPGYVKVGVPDSLMSGLVQGLALKGVLSFFTDWPMNRCKCSQAPATTNGAARVSDGSGNALISRPKPSVSTGFAASSQRLVDPNATSPKMGRI